MKGNSKKCRCNPHFWDGPNYFYEYHRPGLLISPTNGLLKGLCVPPPLFGSPCGQALYWIAFKLFYLKPWDFNPSCLFVCLFALLVWKWSFWNTSWSVRSQEKSNMLERNNVILQALPQAGCSADMFEHVWKSAAIMLPCWPCIWAYWLAADQP